MVATKAYCPHCDNRLKEVHYGMCVDCGQLIAPHLAHVPSALEVPAVDLGDTVDEGEPVPCPNHDRVGCSMCFQADLMGPEPLLRDTLPPANGLSWD